MVLGEDQAEGHLELLDLVLVLWLDHDEERLDVEKIEVSEPQFQGLPVSVLKLFDHIRLFHEVLELIFQNILLFTLIFRWRELHIRMLRHHYAGRFRNVIEQL